MRIESLTFFRYIAAVIVVNFHFGAATGLSGTLVAGPQMVTFFFVLSGFVMVLAYFSRDRIDLRSYWWARFARIFPVYFVALLMMVALKVIKNGGVDPMALTLNLLFLQAWIPPYPLSINSPGWSLSVEMFLYLLFPFVVVAIKRYRISTKMVFAIAFGVWAGTQGVLTTALNLGFYTGYPSTAHDLMVYFPLIHLGGFLLGVAGGVWFLGRGSQGLPRPWSVLPIALSLLLIITILEWSDLIQWYIGLKLPFESGFMAPFFVFCVLSVAYCRSGLDRLLSLRPLVLLGEASYSLYILQAPMYHLYKAVMSRLDLLNPVAEFYVFLVILTLVSIASFLLFERRANRFLRFTVPRAIDRYS